MLFGQFSELKTITFDLDYAERDGRLTPGAGDEVDGDILQIEIITAHENIELQGIGRLVFQNDRLEHHPPLTDIMNHTRCIVDEGQCILTDIEAFMPTSFHNFGSNLLVRATGFHRDSSYLQRSLVSELQGSLLLINRQYSLTSFQR